MVGTLLSNSRDSENTLYNLLKGSCLGCTAISFLPCFSISHTLQFSFILIPEKGLETSYTFQNILLLNSSINEAV